MPELDGIEAARRIYAEQPLPIVMLTAFSDRTERRERDRGRRLHLPREAVPGDRHRPGDSRGRGAARELLRARCARSASTPLKAIFMSLPSQNGGEWPLRILRREDGSLDIRGA